MWFNFIKMLYKIEWSVPENGFIWLAEFYCLVMQVVVILDTLAPETTGRCIEVLESDKDSKQKKRRQFK